MKTTPRRSRRQARPPKQKIVEAVGTASGVGTATAKGQAIHAAAGSATGAGAVSAKSRIIRARKHKYGFRKSGKSEFAQDALQALYAEDFPTHVSAHVLDEVHKYLAHNAEYRVIYGDHKIDRATVTRALQEQRKIGR